MGSATTESEEEEGVSKLSKKSKALLDVKNKPGVVLAVEELRLGPAGGG